MHECLLCKRDMKVSNDVFENGCVRNDYSKAKNLIQYNTKRDRTCGSGKKYKNCCGK